MDDDVYQRITRVCRLCGRRKAIAEFYLTSRRTGTRGHQCRTCLRARRRKYYRENRERLLEAQKEYARREDPEQRRARTKRYHERCTKKRLARLRSGRLRKLGIIQQSDVCPDCGAPATDLHHENYDDVVNLISLCRSCHMKRHWAEWRKHGSRNAPYPWEYEEDE